MAYNINNLKSDLQGLLKGTSTDKITNLTELLNRASRDVLADVDFQETRRTQQITNAIYDQVYDYSVPTDLKGNKIIDVMKQVNRDEKFTLTSAETFNFNNPAGALTIKHNTGVKTLRLSVANLTSGSVLNECNSLTENGTWAATSDASNLTADTLNFISGSGSLNFDVDGSTTTGYLENTTSTSVDLSAMENIGSLFLWLYIPDSSAFTSVNLRWGSSSANYWNVTATTPQGGSFITGWNLIRFDWNGATETGTGVSSAITYLRVTVNYNGTADTDFRLDNIVAKSGAIYLLDYYSKYLFRTAAGVWQEETSADDDIINLDTESYNVYLMKVTELCFAQLGNKLDDVNYYKNEYKMLIDNYKQIYRSEAFKVQEVYYSLFKR